MTDRIVAAVLTTVAALVCGVALWLIIPLLTAGWSHVSFEYLITEPTDAGRSGGIFSILLSTGLILLIAVAAAVPLSIGSAVALSWWKTSATRLHVALDLLAAVPSIVYGLFGNAFFCVALGLGYSILAGGLTLACMILPIVTRVCEQALRDVPQDIKQAAAALGLARSSVLLQVVLPCAAPAIGAGVVLGIGRAMAETAALIFTSGYVSRTPNSVLDSGRAISVHIYDLAMNVANGEPQATAAAAVLIVLLVVMNFTTAAFSRWFGRNMANAETTERRVTRNA
jgi:phosphate transport system permease protein